MYPLEYLWLSAPHRYSQIDISPNNPPYCDLTYTVYSGGCCTFKNAGFIENNWIGLYCLRTVGYLLPEVQQLLAQNR